MVDGYSAIPDPSEEAGVSGLKPFPVAGLSLLELTVTEHGLVVGCPGCGAQTVFPHDDEPVLAHLSVDCEVSS